MSMVNFVFMVVWSIVLIACLGLIFGQIVENLKDLNRQQTLYHDELIKLLKERL